MFTNANNRHIELYREMGRRAAAGCLFATENPAMDLSVLILLGLRILVCSHFVVNTNYGFSLVSVHIWDDK